MPEGSARTEGPAALQVEVSTPDNGRIRATVPLDVSVGEMVERVMHGLGVDNPAAYDLWVPLARSDADEPDWHRLDGHEKLLDALRGVQRAPKITPTNEDQL